MWFGIRLLVMRDRPVLALGISGGRVVAVDNQINSGKFDHPGPVGDLTGPLAREQLRLD